MSVVVVGLSLVTFLVGVAEYWDPRTLNGGFVMDDFATIARHPYVMGADPGLPELFGLDFWGTPLQSAASHKSWRPVTTLSYRWQAGELRDQAVTYTSMTPELRKNLTTGKVEQTSNLFWFHIVNICLHGINSSLSFLAARHFLSPFAPSKANLSALLAALFFAAHPMHCEAVSNISGRAELLCMTFFMLGFLLYVPTVRGTAGGNLASLGGVFACTVLAMLSKEQGILLPPLCVGWELIIYSLYRDDGRLRKAFIGKSLALALSTLALAFVRLLLNGRTSARLMCLQNHIACVPDPIVRFLSFSYLAWVNLYFLVLPLWTAHDWTGGCFPPVTLTQWKTPVVALFLILVLVTVHRMIECAITAPSGQSRAAALCGLWLLGTFVFTSNLVTYVGFIVAERTLYLPSFGFCVLLAYTLQQLLAPVSFAFSSPPAVVTVSSSASATTASATTASATTASATTASATTASATTASATTASATTASVAASPSPSRSMLLLGVSGAILAWYTQTTQQWNYVWSSERALYEHSYAQAPESVSSVARYGTQLIQGGNESEIEKGVEILKVALTPPIDMGWNTQHCADLAIALQKLGRCAEALEWVGKCRERLEVYRKDNYAQIAGKLKTSPLTLIAVVGDRDAREDLKHDLSMGITVKRTYLEVAEWRCLSILKDATLKLTLGDDRIRTVMQMNADTEARDFLVETLKLDPKRVITWWDTDGEERMMYDSTKGEMAAVVKKFNGVFPYHLLTKEENQSFGENRVLRIPEESKKEGWIPPSAPVWTEDRYMSHLPKST